MKKISILLFAALFMFGCVTPQTKSPTASDQDSIEEAKKQIEFAYEKYLEQTNRVNRIATKVRSNGVDICGDFISPFYGFNIWTIKDFPKVSNIEKEVLMTKYGLRENLKIKSVSEGSPADIAGLKFGDDVDEINGKKVKSGYLTNVREKYNELIEKNKEGPLKLKVWRNNKTISLTINPNSACKSNASVIFDSNINAYADGSNIYLTRGMLNFIESDIELATVISHEIAHNIMHHSDAKATNAAVTGIFGLFIDLAAAFYGINTNGDFTKMTSEIGASAYSVEFEQEADYVGIYLMKKAGYEINLAANFWRRMAAENPDAIFTKSTHPTSPERFISISKTVLEIERKIKNNQPMKPELKI